jgi:LDH2 family malate/lactate/ureidoglycolate dehydrogenase
MMPTKEDMIGFCWTINCGNVMAPWGGVAAQLGNNPFAISIPCGKRPSIVLDMATSVVAKGKIELARKTKTPIPITWALDKEGKPTSDAEAAYWGTVQPFGGYKGVGLTFVNAMISAVLSNSNFGENMTDLAEAPDIPNNTGHLLQVVNIASITDVAEFKERMDNAVDYIKNGVRADGIDELYVPGEIEHNNMLRQIEQGIVYPVEVIEEIQTISSNLGVDVVL